MFRVLEIRNEEHLFMLDLSANLEKGTSLPTLISKSEIKQLYASGYKSVNLV